MAKEHEEEGGEKRKEVLEVASKKIKHENIYAALSAFQGELKPMAKNGSVEFDTRGDGKVSFNYTPLGDIMAAIYPLLAKHGLSVRHEISKEGVEAILTHETYQVPKPIYVANRGQFAGTSMEPGRITQEVTKFEEPAQGEIRSGAIALKGASDKMKDVGAAITYARRYTIGLVLGLASEEDKDAQLMEDSAKNAVQYAYSRARKGIEEAKTKAELKKMADVLNRDLEAVRAGKPGALGLSEEQYVELVELGNLKDAELEK